MIGVAGGMLLAGPPEGLTEHRGWPVAAVFAATIVGFLVRPLAMGRLALVALVTLLVAGAFGRGRGAIEGLLAGFADETVWLVVAAFLLSGVVIRTGFGRRIAPVLIRAWGARRWAWDTPSRGSELILGPSIPSNTARGGGVMFPIARTAPALALGAAPDGPPACMGGVSRAVRIACQPGVARPSTLALVAGCVGRDLPALRVQRDVRPAAAQADRRRDARHLQRGRLHAALTDRARADREVVADLAGRRDRRCRRAGIPWSC